MAGPIYTIFSLINSIHNSLQFAPPFSIVAHFISLYKRNDLRNSVAYHFKDILYIPVKITLLHNTPLGTPSVTPSTPIS